MTDWREMTRDAFDRDAAPVQLALEGVPVADTCGTGDLFALLDDDD